MKLTKFIIAAILSVPFLLNAQDGSLKFYYPNGKLESEINYVKDVLNGYSTWYYENGNKRKEVFYSDGKPNGFVKYFYENGLLQAEFSVKEGVRDGLTKFYYSNGALKEVRSYEEGRLVNRITLELDSTYVPPLEAYVGATEQLKDRKNGNNFLCEVEFCPEPIGGMEAIMQKVVYPEHARLYGLEGKVILKVFVDKRGNPQQIDMVKSLGLGCDEAAIDAVRSVKFFPGQQNGKVVDSWVAITINFKLKEEKSRLAESFKPEIDTPEFAYEKLPFEEKTTETPKPVDRNIDTIAVTNTNAFESDRKSSIIIKSGKNETLKKSETVEKKEKKGSEDGKYSSRIIQLLSCDAEICPKPKGGIEEIDRNLVVPKKVKRLKLTGTVIVEADIDEFGYVRNTRVLQKMGHGCDEAAEVAILDTHFYPAESNGKHVRTKLRIAVPFDYRSQ